MRTDESQEAPRALGPNLQRLRQLSALLGAAKAQSESDELDPLQASFDRLLEAVSAQEPDYEFLVQDVLLRLHRRFPSLWEGVDRHLLWFFGGELLHFLSDEELDAFQQRED